MKSLQRLLGLGGWFVSALLLNAAPATLIPFGANWRYLDNGTDQGTNWSQPSFNDSGWSSGPAQLGYSSNPPEVDEATIVSFGPDPNNKYITTYFRRAFVVTNTAEFTNLVARLLLDDGAVVYLNGAEAYRVNMPPGPIAYGTLALTALENTLFTNSIPAAQLVPGTNTLAVEVHQNISISTDLSFDFELLGQQVAPPNTPPTVAITSPTNGASYTAPATIAIAASGSDSDGFVTSVALYQNGSLLFQTAGATANYSWNNVPAGAYTLTAVAFDDGGASGTSAPVNVGVSAPVLPVTNDFIVFGSAWKYHDKGQDLQTAWVQLLYDDTTWSNGLAQLGYGDNDETTRIEDNPTPGYNATDVDRYITSYFRKFFSVTNATAYTNLSLRLLRDDAGVVYLNGSEIYRSPNMPTGSINYQTTTLSPNGENTIDTASFATSGLLVEGTNILAVEIHQQGSTSSDVSFDFALAGIRTPETNARPVVAITGPANGASYEPPAAFTIAASAFDSDGTVTNVAIYVNDTLAATFTSAPYTFVTNNVQAGTYSIFAVATDNVGLARTSAVVTVNVTPIPPTIVSLTPQPNSTVSALTSVSVTFSEPVTGVNAADLLVNSSPATNVTGSGAGPYAFTFPQPEPGVVSMNWASGHGIQDLSGHAFAPSPWSYVLDTNSAGIVINEIMYHPASENPLEEYVELFNQGSSAVNLDGWRLRGVGFTFSNVVLAADSYLVVAADTNAFRAKYPSVANVVGNWTGSLNNNGERLELEDAAGNRVDRVEYSDNGDWAVRQRGLLELNHRGWVWFKPHDGGGASLELVNPNLPNDSGQNWAASIPTNGTPGAVNSRAANNTGPLILETSHFPVVPRSTEPITISARIVDELTSGLAVNLFWRVSATTPPAFTTTPMTDDGMNGDLAANDGLFSVRLPAQANNRVIEFYVSATDAQNNTSTWPRPAIAAADGAGPTGQVVNALFQIDDIVYAPTNAQPLYKLIMTEPERAELQSIPSQSSIQGPNSRMNGTFISIDASGISFHYNCAFRNRGHGSRGANPPNYHVAFRSDDRWKGRRALNINSVTVPAQHLGSVLARKAGAAGATSHAGQVRVNNVNRSSGSYAINEAPDSDYAAAHFPNDPDGNVYRALRDLNGNFDYRGELKGAYTNTYYKESNVSEDDWSDLIGMLRLMGTGNATPFTTENVRSVIRAEQWLRHLAVMNLFGNNETGLNTGYNDDYFMYAGAIDRRFHLTYWDLDSVLGLGNSRSPTDGIFTATLNNGSGLAFDRFMHSPDFEPIYYRILYEILTGPFAPANFDATVDDTLGGYVSVNTIDTIKNFMAQRRSYVLSILPPTTDFRAPTAIVTGVPRSPTPFASATLMVGGANVEAYQFSLNGGEYSGETLLGDPIVLSSLPSGTNTVAVIARGANGMWQDVTNATVVTWVVNPSWPTVRINEVLAQNDAALNHQGTFPDAIELFNEGNVTVNLGGMRLTDDRDQPNKFTFPANTLLGPGAYLTVFANNNDGTPGFHLGFTLDAEGDSIHLFDAIVNGGARLDSVKFGRQIADLSIGRLGNGGDWQLTQATFGDANTLQPLGDPRSLRINEFLATGAAQDDFIELYNASGLPVSLGGLYLNDNLIGDPARNRIEPLNFMAANSYWALTANGNGNGSDRLNFKLALELGEIGLLAEDLSTIDCAIYGPQQLNVSQGRCPSSGVRFVNLTTPTPGAPNACPAAAPGGFVLINEVLANNASLEEPDGSKPDWIEIYNPAVTNVDLGDMSLTDDTMAPRRWVFPAGTIVNAGGYLKVRCDADLPASTTNTGFGLKANGGSVYLFDSLANGGLLLSSVSYGLQAADFSIGRVPDGSTNWVLTTPTLGGLNLAASLGDPTQLRINEWMANPATGDDYFELFNPNPQPVDISRFYLTDSLTARTKHPLPALSFIGVGQNGFQLFIADGNTTAGADHVNFSLRAQGEDLGLTSAGNVAIDGFSFGAQASGVSAGRLPDGAATIVNFPATPTPGESNFLPLDNVVVNEVLAHSDPPLEDAVEFHNPSGAPVDVSGWYLSDSQNNLLKYRIPDGTIVPAGGFVVFYEYQFNADVGVNAFSFSSARGDEVYLSQSTGPGTLTGYRAFATFGASENGVSFGRFATSAGADFTAMSARTFGADMPATTNEFRSGTGLSNAYPKVGPVVINEIMYNPLGTNDVLEFVELRNITAAPVPLYDTNNPANTWRLRKGVDFNFPQSTTIPAGSYVVVVSFDPLTDPTARADFESAYGTGMTLLGPYSGKLDNGGEAIELQKPDAPQTIPGPDFGFVPYVVADRVVYSDAAPWPTSPDGSGDALKKVTSTLYGNEPLNWQGGAPTPGAANFAAATNSAPTLAPIANRSIHVGYPVTFTASATDSDLPAQTLLFSLDAPVPGGASIGTGSGVFTWTPATNQGPATYTITVRVTDNGTPPLSDTKSFQIAVLAMPRVSSVEITNGMVNITWESYAGRRYRVETTTSLSNPIWVQVGSDIQATGSSSTLTVLGGTDPQRFYRVISFDN